MSFNWKKAKQYEQEQLSDNDYSYSKIKKKDLKPICNYPGCAKVLKAKYFYCYDHFLKTKKD